MDIDNFVKLEICYNCKRCVETKDDINPIRHYYYCNKYKRAVNWNDDFCKKGEF